MLISFLILTDDDPTSGNLLKVLQEYPELSCAGVTGNFEEGMNIILKDTPDVIFIDADASCLPEDYEHIFSYCNDINDHICKKPRYIALSCDASKAYRALKHKFYDYLLKPGKELEVRKVILRLIKEYRCLPGNILCLKSYKDYTILPVDEILFLKADNNTTDFVMTGGRTLSAFKTLKFFEKNLPGNFIRIHHSYIVNKDQISRINFGKLKCYLSRNKISLPFSKSYRHNLYALEKYLEQKAISFA